jgi:hypothetical protein
MCFHEVQLLSNRALEQCNVSPTISIDDQSESIAEHREQLRALHKDVDVLHKVMSRVRDFSLKLEAKGIIALGDTNSVWAATVQRLEVEPVATVIVSLFFLN